MCQNPATSIASAIEVQPSSGSAFAAEVFVYVGLWLMSSPNPFSSLDICPSAHLSLRMGRPNFVPQLAATSLQSHKQVVALGWMVRRMIHEIETSKARDETSERNAQLRSSTGRARRSRHIQRNGRQATTDCVGTSSSSSSHEGGSLVAATLHHESFNLKGCPQLRI
jgi:hypothetical protein